jgi:flagellar biosynthesis/type III secretory pathway M-ring protein FliF/YscJ
MNLSWELLIGVGVVLLLAALIYATLRASRATPREEAASEAATKAQYDHPDDPDAAERPGSGLPPTPGVPREP